MTDDTPPMEDLPESPSASQPEGGEVPAESPQFSTETPVPQMVDSHHPAKRRKRRSLFWPILLILGGVVLLLNNIGAMNQDIWGTLLNLWPILFIALGLDSIWRGEGITGAVVSIGLGTVFLLINLGYIEMSIWRVLLTVWPVFLIAIGIDILIAHRRSFWLNLFASVLILTLLGGILWMAGIGLTTGNVIPGDQIQVDAQGATTARIVLAPGAGSLLVHKLVGSDALLAGTVPFSGQNYQVKQTTTFVGDKAVVKIMTVGVQLYVPGGDNKGIWDIGITPVIPVELWFEIGAGETKIDLTGLSILNSVNHQMGVGQIEIVLPETGNFALKVDCAVCTVRIIVPAGMELQLQADTALVTRSLPAGYSKTAEDRFASPGFTTSENQVKLEVDMAIGVLEIKQK
jgi:hypothetical protein